MAHARCGAVAPAYVTEALAPCPRRKARLSVVITETRNAPFCTSYRSYRRFTGGGIVQTDRGRNFLRRMPQQKAGLRACCSSTKYSAVCPCSLVRDIKGDCKAGLPWQLNAKRELHPPSLTLWTQPKCCMSGKEPGPLPGIFHTKKLR